MRYQDWDTLLFAESSTIPLPEFKTTCHVVQDQEYLGPHHVALLVPTVTSFIPSLEPGETFKVSIHSWQDPCASQYIHDYTQHPELVVFEARIFVDGRLIGMRMFDSTTHWPAVIDTGLDLTKNGDFEKLIFPNFHSALLTHNCWNAGDEYGRIKIVISEGFERASDTNRFDRIKAVVAFSFQHAPLEVLEASSIAWPNIHMWRQGPLAAYMGPASPTRRPRQAIETHGHSPRHKINMSESMLPTPVRTGPLTAIDIKDNVHRREESSTDISMPDYSAPGSFRSDSRRTTDPLAVDSKQYFPDMDATGAYEYVAKALAPSELAIHPIFSKEVSMVTSEVISNNSLKTSADNTPIKRKDGKIRSRKENMNESPTHEETGIADHQRKTAHVPPGSTAKRQRVSTPVSFEVIDQEDEPDPTHLTRSLTQKLGLPGENERRVLSGIDHNVL